MGGIVSIVIATKWFEELYMEEYESPVLELFRLKNDVIATSGCHKDVCWTDDSVCGCNQMV